MKVIVAGPRGYDNYEFVKSKLDYYLSKTTEPITIISGACDDKKNGKLTYTRPDGTNVYGVDGLGERYAAENGYPVQYFPANWERYGLSAGPLRNEQMAECSTHCIVFRGPFNKGSKNMWDMAVKYKLIRREIKI